MNMKELLKKLEEAGATEDLLKKVAELDNSEKIAELEAQIESEQGKSASLLADKRKFKERAETAEDELKKIELEKLPEEERRQKELSDLNEKLETERQERAQEKAEFERVQRDGQLLEIAGTIKWADGVPSSTSKMIVTTALKDVEDLSDEKAVKDVLATVTESHKALIQANAAAGTGGTGGSGGADDDLGGGEKEGTILGNQQATWGDK